jgi:hypothetical protein
MTDTHDLTERLPLAASDAQDDVPDAGYMAWRGRPAAIVPLVLGDDAVVQWYLHLRFHEVLMLAGEDGWQLVRVVDAAEDVSTLFFRRSKAEG